jgi:hypothetical protein
MERASRGVKPAHASRLGTRSGGCFPVATMLENLDVLHLVNEVLQVKRPTKILTMPQSISGDGTGQLHRVSHALPFAVFAAGMDADRNPGRAAVPSAAIDFLAVLAIAERGEA